jgi:predicted CoA-binding protein
VRDAQQILAEAKVIAVVAGIDYVEDRCLVIERANGNLSQLS